MDPKLTFVSHITEKVGKARKGVGIIRHFNNYLPFKTLNQMYKLYVRPHLDYADVIFHIPSRDTDYLTDVGEHYLMRT